MCLFSWLKKHSTFIKLYKTKKCPFSAQLSVSCKDFRSAYDNLREVRALLFPKLPAMALTATIPEISLVKGSKNRMNIFYSVSKFEKCQDNDYEKVEMAFTNSFQLTIRDLKENGFSAERGIVFCFSHRDCCEVYEYFKRELG